MLLISDYDGTIKKYFDKPTRKEKKDFAKEIEAINDYVSSGNDLLLTTMRKTPSIKDEILRHKLLYNYLTAYNGLVTLDNKDRIVTANYIGKENINEINKVINNCTVELYNEYGKTKDSNNVVMMGIRSLTPINILKKTNELGLYYHYDGKTIWVHKQTNKLIGVNRFLETINYERNNIYSVGDSKDDLKMLEEYNGYYIANGYLEKDIKHNLPKVDNVRTLIKKIK